MSELIVLDPSGSGRVGKFYSGANGNTTAHMEQCGERIVVHVNGDKVVAYPDQFVDTNGNTIGSAEDVLEYIQTNFKSASGGGGVTMQEVKDYVEGYAIQIDEKGESNGVATLDSGGKIPVSQLPNSVMTLEGEWDASTNTPELQNGIGDAGMVYEVTTAGTQDLGSGDITFAVGDWVVYGADGLWYKSLNSNEVTSVFGRTGTVTAQNGDYTADQVTGALKQGGNAFGSPVIVGTTDNNTFAVIVNNVVRLNVNATGSIYGPTISNAFGFITFGSSATVPGLTVTKGATSGTAAVLYILNSNAGNTGSLIEASSNIAGTTATRFSVLKDGTVIAPNVQYANSVESTSLTLSNPGYYTNTGSAVTYTVPAPSGRTGTKYTIINMGSGSITVAGGFEDIWDAGTLYTSISVGVGEVVTLYNNGSKWVVI